MNANILERKIETSKKFSLRVELNELFINGIVNFKTKKYNNIENSWNGRKLKIPVYGVYKISWGFSQNSFDTFYNDCKAELSLVTNNKEHTEKAIINSKTPSYFAKKSSHKTITLLLREDDIIFLNANILHKENIKMDDIYLDIIKLNTEETSLLDYEN